MTRSANRRASGKRASGTRVASKRATSTRATSKRAPSKSTRRTARPLSLFLQGVAIVNLVAGLVMTAAFTALIADPDAEFRIVILGALLIAVSALRWGIAVLRGESRMFYFPGLSLKVSDYGLLIATLTMIFGIPGYLILAFSLDTWLVLPLIAAGYLGAIAMIAVCIDIKGELAMREQRA